MTLWIRSQDHKYLLEAKEVYIREERLVIDETGTRIAYSDYDNKVELKFVIYVNDNFLGIYSTKERALEVLDEIQKKITEANFLWIENNGVIIREKWTEDLKNSVKEGLPILDSKLQLKSTNVDNIVYDMPQE